MTMPYGAKLTAPQVKEIVARFEKGESSHALARAFGVCQSTVIRHAHSRGVSPGPRRKIDMAHLRTMVESGARRCDMRAHFGVSDPALHNALRRLKEAA